MVTARELLEKYPSMLAEDANYYELQEKREMEIRGKQQWEIPGTWASRQLSFWQKKRREDYHLYWCRNCQVWYCLTDDQRKDAEGYCECDNCGNMIANEVIAFWQVTELLQEAIDNPVW